MADPDFKPYILKNVRWLRYRNPNSNVKHSQPRSPYVQIPEFVERAAEIDKLRPNMRAFLNRFHDTSYAIKLSMDDGESEIKFKQLKILATAADNETFYGFKMNDDGSHMQFFKGKNTQSAKSECFDYNIVVIHIGTLFLLEIFASANILTN